MEHIESLHNRILLESFPDDIRGLPLRITEPSKIVMPEKYAESSRYARVVAFGPKAMRDELKVGDVVLTGRYPQSAWSFEHEGRELVSVKEDEILARIEIEPDFCMCMEPECVE